MIFNKLEKDIQNLEKDKTMYENMQEILNNKNTYSNTDEINTIKNLKTYLINKTNEINNTIKIKNLKLDKIKNRVRLSNLLIKVFSLLLIFVYIVNNLFIKYNIIVLPFIIILIISYALNKYPNLRIQRILVNIFAIITCILILNIPNLKNIFLEYSDYFNILGIITAAFLWIYNITK